MRAIKVLSLAGLLTAAACTIGQASAAAPTSPALKCSIHAHLTAPLAQTGALAGSATCGRALGKGSYRGRYRDDVSHWPLASETGSGRLSFKTASLRGTYQVGPQLSSAIRPWRGTFHITGGTGRFKHASGTLKMTCVHLIPPLTNCTISG